MITGSREWNSWEKFNDGVYKALLCFPEISLMDIEFCHGEAKGADIFIERYCTNGGLLIPKVYPADWNKYGKAAGPIRNIQMLDDFKPDLVLAFFKNDAKNIGTRHAVAQALKRHITVVITPD